MRLRWQIKWILSVGRLEPKSLCPKLETITNFGRDNGTNRYLSIDIRYVNQYRNLRFRFCFCFFIRSNARFDTFRSLVFPWRVRCTGAKALLLISLFNLIWNAQIKYIFTRIDFVNNESSIHTFPLCARICTHTHNSFSIRLPTAARCVQTVWWMLVEFATRCPLMWPKR